MACREEAEKRALVRIVRGADGSAVIDRTGRAAGRGAYLHRTAACIETARKRRNIDRSLGANVPPEVWAGLGV